MAVPTPSTEPCAATPPGVPTSMPALQEALPAMRTRESYMLAMKRLPREASRARALGMLSVAMPVAPESTMGVLRPEVVPTQALTAAAKRLEDEYRLVSSKFADEVKRMESEQQELNG